MLLPLFEFLRDRIGLALFVALGAGMTLPQCGLLMPVVLPAIGLLLFLAALQMAPAASSGGALRGVGTVAAHNAVVLFGAPFLVWMLGTWIDSPWTLGMLIVSAVGAGTSAPALALLLSGRAGLSLPITISSNLLAIFSLPLVLEFAGGGAEVDGVGVLVSLLLVLGLPFALARFARPFVLKRMPADNLGVYAGGISVICLMVMVAGPAANSAPVVYAEPQLGLASLVWSLVPFVLMGLVGIAACWLTCKPGERLPTWIAHIFNNNSLAVSITTLGFDTHTQVLGVTSMIWWVLGVGAVKFWASRQP